MADALEGSDITELEAPFATGARVATACRGRSTMCATTTEGAGGRTGCGLHQCAYVSQYFLHGFEYT